MRAYKFGSSKNNPMKLCYWPAARQTW